MSQRLRWCVSWLAVCALATALVGLEPAPACAQSVTNYTFTPLVIPSGFADPVLFEVTVSGQPTRVTIDFAPGSAPVTSIELVDNGTNGDRTANDHVYTARLPSSPILAALQADDVQRVFMGFLNVFNGATSVLRGNMFVDVYSASVGVWPVSRLSQFVQATHNLVNIWDAAFFVNFDATHVTQEFYRWFGDDYDFLNIISTPARFANRDHFAVRNDVAGTGVSRINDTARYGSQGRLLGISRFPVPTFYDGANTGYIHELGHQWISFLNFSPLTLGIPHWPLSSMAGGVMGFSIGGAGGQGGTFACDVTDKNGTIILNPRSGGPPYTDFDLYLMGLLAPNQVHQQIVFADQTAAQSLLGNCNGQAFTGAVIRLDAADIASHMGTRDPPAGQAPTHFRAATVLVTRDDVASQETMSLYSWLTARAELKSPTAVHEGFVKQVSPPFFAATGGRATLDTTIGSGGGESFAMVATPTAQTVVSGSSAVFAIAVKPTGPSVDVAITLACASLPAHASCAFAPGSVTPGLTGASAVLTVATKDTTAGGSAGAAAVLVIAAIATLALRHQSVSSLGWRRLFWAAGLTAACAACGGNKPAPPTSSTTPKGTYTLNVVGTAGATQQTATITLTVQ